MGNPPKDMTRRKKRNFLTLIAICTALTLFAILGIVQSQKASQSIAFAKDLPNSHKGLPTIGGAFELIDCKGKLWKDTDFKGKPFLIYFGYTYCPDICPTALYNMTQALEKLGKSKVVKPIFITVDPERDTTSQLQLYSQNFHKDFVMLTGTKAQVNQAVKAYRVHAARASQERGEGDYLVDHSSIIYLMDKNGQFVAHFNHQTQPEEIVERVKTYIETGK
jgi:cytochrome oxidase Cu insertion factor (SCO1/SenC/PrrC family)